MTYLGLSELMAFTWTDQKQVLWRYMASLELSE